jgi:hypothetical protein
MTSRAWDVDIGWIAAANLAADLDAWAATPLAAAE